MPRRRLRLGSAATTVESQAGEQVLDALKPCVLVEQLDQVYVKFGAPHLQNAHVFGPETSAFLDAWPRPSRTVDARGTRGRIVVLPGEGDRVTRN